MESQVFFDDTFTDKVFAEAPYKSRGERYLRNDDDGIFDFKLKYLGKEVLKTKFGKVECYKFRPMVQSGRVFKEQESLSLWVSADDNRIPIRISADLAVGAIKADLDAYNGLKHQFKIIMD